MSKQAKTLTAEELRRVLDHVATRKHSVRNRALVSFSFYAGCRVGEISSLLYTDVVDTDGSVRSEVVLRAENTKTKEARTVFINAKLKKEGVEGLRASDTSQRKKIEESLHVHRAHRLGGARLQAGQYKASLFKSCQSGRPSQLVGRVDRLDESEIEGIKTTSSVPWASRGPLAAFCIHGGPPGLGDLPLGTGSFVASPPRGLSIEEVKDEWAVGTFRVI